MITGIVNSKGESILRLVVGDHETKRVVADSVVDTGYTGLPISQSHIPA